MDPSTTNPEIKLVDGPTRYLETAATTTTMDSVTIRGNGIKIG